MEEEGPHALEMAQKEAQAPEAQDQAQGRRALVKPAKNLLIKTINRFREVYQEYF